MVLIRSNSELMAAEAKKAQEAQDEAINSPMSELASYVHSVWDDAIESKDDAEEIMEQSIRQRNGIYDADKLAKIQEQGGSEIFMLLTDEKCTALKAWLYDLLLPPNDNPYNVDPTPVPELNDDQMALIEEKAKSELMENLMAMQQLGSPISQDEIQERMLALVDEIKHRTKAYAEGYDSRLKNKIDDVVVESMWREAFAEVLDDIVDLPAGILKGPIVESEQQLSWQKDVDGKYVPVVEDGVQVKFKRVSPFDIYPVGASTGVDDGDLFEKHRLTIKDLEALKLVEEGGFQEDLIDSVLLEADTGKYSHWTDPDDDLTTSRNKEQQEDGITDEWNHQYGQKVEALQFWGAIPGHMLMEYGVDIPDEDVMTIFDAEVWIIGPYVIKAKINSHPLGKKPYYVGSLRKRNGSFWGEGLPQIIRDIQDVCNSTSRSLINNMAISSGPQVGVDNGRLAEGETITSMYPWKIWQFDEQSTMNNAGGRPPLWFFQPDSNAQELMAVYQFFSTEADNKSGVPRYSYGSGGGTSALGTATGMTMMMNNASKGIKQVVRNIDDGIIAPSIRAIHTHLMLWDEDESIKGDIKIKATGSSALLAKEQMQVRLNEAMNIASSDLGLKIIGEEGLAAIFRAVFKGLDADIEDVIPTKEEIKERMAKEAAMMQQQMQMQQMGGMQQAPAPVATNAAGSVAGGSDVGLYQQTPMG